MHGEVVGLDAVLGERLADIERLSRVESVVSEDDSGDELEEVAPTMRATTQRVGNFSSYLVSDCSHFCLHSAVSRNWMETLVLTVLFPRLEPGTLASTTERDSST